MNKQRKETEEIKEKYGDYVPTLQKIHECEKPTVVDYIEGNDTPKENKKKINDVCEWIESSNETFIPTNSLTIHQKLPGGIYDIDYNSNRGCFVFKKKTLCLDELLNLPDPTFDLILKDMKYFWENEHKFKKYNFAHKRGILLHGPPGCGKTSLTALLSNYIIENKDGIVLTIKNGRDLENYASAVPDVLRIIQPNTPILTTIEDLDGLVSYKDYEALLLNILDGFNQLSNIVYVGCTNYPELLKDRILNRPSRFDKRYYIGTPLANVRKFYLESKIKEEDLKLYDIDYIVEKTERLTLAHLGELVKSVYIFGNDLDESIEELHDMGKFISSTKYETNEKKTGFNK
jgi:DNA replication protein DnaC